MRNITLIVALMLAGCFLLSGATSEPVPEVGITVKRGWVKASEGHICMTHSAQLDPCFQGVFHGVRFTVAYSEKTRRISYLHTSDSKFRTANGLRVGDELSVTENNVRTLPGWEVWAPTTDDGWRPIIGFNSEVKLKDGTLLNVGGRRDGSKEGFATVQAFSRGRL